MRLSRRDLIQADIFEAESLAGGMLTRLSQPGQAASRKADEEIDLSEDGLHNPP